MISDSSNNHTIIDLYNACSNVKLQAVDPIIEKGILHIKINLKDEKNFIIPEIIKDNHISIEFNKQTSSKIICEIFDLIEPLSEEKESTEIIKYKRSFFIPICCL
jgi:hypothetical protein